MSVYIYVCFDIYVRFVYMSICGVLGVLIRFFLMLFVIAFGEGGLDVCGTVGVVGFRGYSMVFFMGVMLRWICV